MIEAVTRNGDNIVPNHNCLPASKIPKKAALAEINHKIAPNSKQMISRINSNVPNARRQHRQTGKKTKVRGQKKCHK
jgi:hypothetical protein